MEFRNFWVFAFYDIHNSCLLTGQSNDEALAAKMLHLSQKVNTLKQRVEDENLGKRTAIWKEPSNNLDDFPRLTEDDLRNITCGVYQIKMSSSYIHEHLINSLSIEKMKPFFE